MDQTPLPISDLLALRDGELREANSSADDPQVQTQLTRMRALRQDLQTLPDVPIGAGTWQDIAALADARSATARARPHWLRYPFATAASVFVASLLGIYLTFSSLSPGESGAAAPALLNAARLEAGSLRLAGLMNRSRQLEMRLRGEQMLTHASEQSPAPAHVAVQPTLIERRLMGRLADVDAQIASMFERGSQDPQLRERLWTQRVSLLESLVTVRDEQASAWLEDSRSM